MGSRIFLASALFLSAMAAPSGPPGNSASLLERQCCMLNPECPATITGPGNDFQPYVATMGFYSDRDCVDRIGFRCTYVAVALEGPGSNACAAGEFPPRSPFWAKIDYTDRPDVEIIATLDQSCPPAGPGAIFAVLKNSGACVEFGEAGRVPGITIFPFGGSGFERLPGNDTFSSDGTGQRSETYQGLMTMPAEESLQLIARQANPRCEGFTIESQEDSTTRAQQISAIIACTAGDTPCSITLTESESKSFTTSFSTSAGAGIEGVFSVSATFGVEYTEEVTSSLSVALNVPPGQRGYAVAFNRGTLFR